MKHGIITALIITGISGSALATTSSHSLSQVPTQQLVLDVSGLPQANPIRVQFKNLDSKHEIEQLVSDGSNSLSLPSGRYQILLKASPQGYRYTLTNQVFSVSPHQGATLTLHFSKPKETYQLLFSPYKDVSVNASWVNSTTTGIGTLVNGYSQPLTEALPPDVKTVTWGLSQQRYVKSHRLLARRAQESSPVSLWLPKLSSCAFRIPELRPRVERGHVINRAHIILAQNLM